MNELVEQYVEPHVPLLIAVVVLVGVITVAVWWLFPKLIVWNAKRQLPADERELFAVKQELLELEDYVELYAPGKRFMKEIETPADKDKKAPAAKLQSSWSSPYPSAVKAANKRNKVLKTAKRVLQARKQIAEAAKYVAVRELPEALQPGNAGLDHFYLEFQLVGRPDKKVKDLADALRSTLGLHSLTFDEQNNFRVVRFVAHKTETVDKLTLNPVPEDFFEKNPVERITSIPLALKADGTTWSLPIMHTLIHGTSGSGKSGPIQGIIRQMEPFVNQGLVKLYGLDPKNAEMKSYRNTSLFSGLALSGNDQMIDMIHHVHDVMKDRQDNVPDTIENDWGRSLPITKETPMILILIDELLSLLSRLQKGGKAGQAAMQRLTEILAQGRSGNIYVIAATQSARQDLMGDMRDNFSNFIVLKLKGGQDYWNDYWLGAGSAARGFDATVILPARADNGYATAGIGYVVEETGDPVRVRFARTTKHDLAKVFARNPITPGHDAHKQTPADDELADGFNDLILGGGVTQDELTDDDGDFSMTEDQPTNLEDIDFFDGPAKVADLGDTQGAMPDLSELSLPDLNSNTNH